MPDSSDDVALGRISAAQKDLGVWGTSRCVYHCLRPLSLGLSLVGIEADQEQIGPGEVVSDAQKRLPRDRSDRVGAAVTEVQGSRVPALAEPGRNSSLPEHGEGSGPGATRTTTELGGDLLRPSVRFPRRHAHRSVHLHPTNFGVSAPSFPEVRDQRPEVSRRRSEDRRRRSATRVQKSGTVARGCTRSRRDLLAGRHAR